MRFRKNAFSLISWSCIFDFIFLRNSPSVVLFVGAQLTRAFSLSHTLTIHLHTSPQNNNVGILNIENIATRNGEKQEQQLQQLPQEKMANWKKWHATFLMKLTIWMQFMQYVQCCCVRKWRELHSRLLCITAVQPYIHVYIEFYTQMTRLNNWIAEKNYK